MFLPGVVMGAQDKLHINWNLRFKGGDHEAAQRIEQLRRQALDLPFDSIGPVVDLAGDDCLIDLEGEYDEHEYWEFRLDAVQWLDEELFGETKLTGDAPAIMPLRIIGFKIFPLDSDCEIRFFLARYPESITVKTDSGSSIKLPTQLNGWSGSGFCIHRLTQSLKFSTLESNVGRCLAVMRVIHDAATLGLLDSARESSEAYSAESDASGDVSGGAGGSDGASVAGDFLKDRNLRTFVQRLVMDRQPILDQIEGMTQRFDEAGLGPFSN